MPALEPQHVSDAPESTEPEDRLGMGRPAGAPNDGPARADLGDKREVLGHKILDGALAGLNRSPGAGRQGSELGFPALVVSGRHIVASRWALTWCQVNLRTTNG